MKAKKQQRSDENQVRPIPSMDPYTVSNVAVSANNTLTMDLTNAAPNNQIAENLKMEMTFYQNGIAQVVITCPGEEPRFAISETGLPVVWEQLQQVKNLSQLKTSDANSTTITLNNSDGDQWQYIVQYNPFRIFLYANGALTTIVNHDDSLRYAALDAPHNTYWHKSDQLIEGYEVGVGFVFSAVNVYGLPMRASTTFPLE